MLAGYELDLKNRCNFKLEFRALVLARAFIVGMRLSFVGLGWDRKIDLFMTTIEIFTSFFYLIAN